MSKKKISILIIDDEPAMRDACLQVLHKDGYRADEATNGPEGLEMARTSAPDVVLVDLKMPGMSGMDVLLKLKEIDPGIVSIVITGYATIDSAVEAIKRGAYDFLPKPFTPDQLRLTLSRALERRKIVMEMERLKSEKKQMEEHFITLVSHQMRSPLVAVGQYLEAILDENTGELNAQQRKMLSRARERLEGTRNMINEWLSMARISKGDFVCRFEEVAITDLVSDLVTFLQPVARKNNLTIRVKAPAYLSTINGDRSALEQVFSNLITNAIHYNRENGSISVEFKNDGSMVSVEVADTGVGIDKKHLPFLFNEFYSVKRKDDRKTDGSGLGLAIVKKIVQAHHGKVEVTSTPGKGSTFTVHLPVNQP